MNLGLKQKTNNNGDYVQACCLRGHGLSWVSVYEDLGSHGL